MNQILSSALFALIALTHVPAARADDAVVGAGTAASCTEAALDAALAQLYPGATFLGGNLTFNCGVDPVVITFTTQKALGFGSGTTVDGGGKVTFDGVDSTRLLVVTGDQSRVQVRNLVLARGNARAGFGGAIFVGVGVSLELDQVTVRDSRADFSGGGIFTEAGSGLALNASVISGNTANHGGGIAANGDVVLTDCQILQNLAALDEGGGLQVYFAATTVLRTLIGQNGAVTGGGFLQRGGTATFTDSGIFSNVATGRGGGVSIYDDARVELVRTRIESNRAAQGGGLYLGSVNQGPGSIEPVSANNATVVDSGIARNRATEGGGAYVSGVAPFFTGRVGGLSMRRSALSENVADRGGGIYSQGYVVLDDLAVRFNRAIDGAGLYLAPTLVGTLAATDSRTGDNILVRTRIADNVATGFGGGVYANFAIFGGLDVVLQRNSAMRGGGVALVRTSYAFLNRISVIDNSAVQAGAGVYIETALQPGVLRNSTLSGNLVNSGGRGGQIYVTTDTAAFPTVRSRLDIQDSTLFGGSAPIGASIYVETQSGVTYTRSILGDANADACGSDGNGTIQSLGFNALQGFSCPFGAAGDFAVSTQADLRLDPLASNGGFMPTHLPALDSIAVDRYDCPTSSSSDAMFDQRQLPRRIDANNDGLPLCDSGAVERQLIEGNGSPGGRIFADGFEGV